MPDRPDPYLKQEPGNIIRAADWNEAQVLAREALASHDHAGADGRPIARAGIAEKAIDGSRIDPAASVEVQKLHVKDDLKVRGRAILDEVDRLLATVASLKSTAGGNVGIGTNTPAGRLTIGELKGTAHNPNSGTLVIDHEDNGGASSIVFRSKVNRGSDYGFIQYQDAAKLGGPGEGALLIVGTSDDPDDHIVLMPSGNVGIGTTDPVNKLQIAGNLHMDGHSIFLRTGPADQYDVVKWNSTTDRVDIGGYRGVSLGYTRNAPGNVSPVMTVDSGNVGIEGSLRAKSVRVTRLVAHVSQDVALSTANTWGDFPQLAVQFNLAQEADVTAFYGITMHGASPAAHLVTRLILDNAELRECRSISGNTQYWSPSSAWMGTLAAGAHTLKVQYRTPHGGTLSPGNDFHKGALMVTVHGVV